MPKPVDPIATVTAAAERQREIEAAVVKFRTQLDGILAGAFREGAFRAAIGEQVVFVLVRPGRT